MSILENLTNSPQSFVVVLDSTKNVLLVGNGILALAPLPKWSPDFEQVEDLVPFHTKLMGVGNLSFIPAKKEIDGKPFWVLMGCKNADPHDLQKNLFLSYVVHELRTPISALFSWSELLSNHMLEKPSEVAEAHQILFHESMRLSDSLTKLLHFFRLETGRTSLETMPCNLDDVLKKSTQHLQDLSEKHSISIFFEENSGPSTLVQADQTLLQVALVNLIENAILYSAASREVEIKQEQDAQFAYVEIRDEGIGFPLHLLDRILQAYHCAIPELTSRSGIGLGLPTAERIIQLHGGTLEVRRNQPQGTVVRISLPLAL